MEVSRAGEENVWGEVTAWEPPGRIAFTWTPNLEKDGCTEIEVRVTSNGGGTSVELEHRDWDVLGERGQVTRDRYSTGWDPVLARYAAGV